MRTVLSLLLLLSPWALGDTPAEPQELDYYDGMTHATGKHGDVPKTGISRHSAAGRPGNASDVSATIEVWISNDMTFESNRPMQFSPWQTVQLELRNDSGMNHQFSLGTAKEHEQYRKLLRSNPKLRREERENLRLLGPGERQTLIWIFAPGEGIEAACNFPGHYQAGMRLPISISAPADPPQQLPESPQPLPEATQ